MRSWILLAMMMGMWRGQENTPAPPRKPTAILVELFTSEGCSSCPPADALLARMDGNRLPSGQTVIALSEHVTYWNHDGWTDPFSQEVFTNRQAAYGEVFHLDSVYTPQMVVGGLRQLTPNNSAALVKSFSAVEEAKVELRVLASVPAPQGYTLTVDLRGPVPPRGADLYAVLADDRVVSHVERGENSGRTLTHVAVARSVGRTSKVREAGIVSVSVPLPRPVAAEGSTARHFVVFLQEAGPGRILGVTSFALQE